jgi:hypothetical protein
MFRKLIVNPHATFSHFPFPCTQWASLVIPSICILHYISLFHLHLNLPSLHFEDDWKFLYVFHFYFCFSYIPFTLASVHSFPIRNSLASRSSTMLEMSLDSFQWNEILSSFEEFNFIVDRYHVPVYSSYSHSASRKKGPFLCHGVIQM